MAIEHNLDETYLHYTRWCEICQHYYEFTKATQSHGCVHTGQRLVPTEEAQRSGIPGVTSVDWK